MWVRRRLEAVGSVALSAEVQDLCAGTRGIAALEVSLLWHLGRRLPLPPQPDQALEWFQALLDDSADFTARAIGGPRAGQAAHIGQAPGYAVYLSSLVKVEQVDTQLERLTSGKYPGRRAGTRIATREQAISALLKGQALLLGDAASQPWSGVALDVARSVHRSIDRPATETSVQGPQASLTEDAGISQAQLRSNLRDPRLRLEGLTIGTESRTQVYLCSVAGVVDERLVDEARRRLGAIQVAQVHGVEYVGELIQDAPRSVFPTVSFTERPDVLAAALLEGRFAIITDGSPHALIAPATFWTLLKSPNDYYQRYPAASFLRMLRHSMVLTALVMPALYIAITTYHQQMLPPKLLLTIAKARQGVPFPAVVEALLMELALEILTEAAMAMPEKLSSGLTVVGAIIIGQAAVAAGLVSWPMVVVISVTALATFAIPHWSLALTARLLRFLLMVVAAIFGLPGVTTGVTLILVHLLSTRSFGVPYLYPAAPMDPQALGDVVVRRPHWAQGPRPRLLRPVWRRRRRGGRAPVAQGPRQS